MEKCKSITNAGKRCSRPSRGSGYCFQHDIIAQNRMLKHELKVMHERVRSYSSKLSDANHILNVIDEVDRIKTAIIEIDPNSKVRDTITNRKYRPIVESIFKLPHYECLSRYFELLDERNRHCHPHSMKRFFRMDAHPKRNDPPRGSVPVNRKDPPFMLRRV